jgi:hypothetical protein
MVPATSSPEQDTKDEKPVQINIERSESLQLIPDPDEGKTDEERRIVVRPPLPPINEQKGETLTLFGIQDRKLMWKVDLWLIPWLCLLYLLSFLDRTNIGNARLAGMELDLSMKGHDYNNALTIFFVRSPLQPVPISKRVSR